MKNIIFLVITLIALIGLAGCSGSEASPSDSGAASEPVEGGELNVAIGADPNTLDWMYTGESAARKLGWHIYEGLFAMNQDFEAAPLLAEDYEVSEDGKTYTITLREGVTFHNGEPVTAEDAKASIERWLKVSSVGKITNDHVESVEADGSQLTIQLNKAYSSLLSDLAAPKSAAVILPKEVAEAAGEKPLDHDQYIGTGPFQFDSWKRGDEIVLSKYDDYASRTDETSGLTGEKKAYVDSVHFKIVKDPQVVVNGLKTGLYDFGDEVPLDLYEVIESTPNIEAGTATNGYTVLTPDKSEAPFDDLQVRQA